MKEQEIGFSRGRSNIGNRQKRRDHFKKNEKGLVKKGARQASGDGGPPDGPATLPAPNPDQLFHRIH